MFKNLTKPFKLFRYSKLTEVCNSEMQVSIVSYVDIALSLDRCLDRSQNQFLHRLACEVGKQHTVSAAFPSFPFSACAEASFPPSSALRFLVWTKSTRKAKASPKHMLKQETICGLCNVCLLRLLARKWTSNTAFEAMLGSAHLIAFLCCICPHARSEFLVLCNAGWCFSSAEGSCGFSLVSLSPPVRGRRCRAPSWCVWRCYPSSALGLKCSCHSAVWITGNLICWVERVKWTLTEKLYLSLSG